MNPRRRLLLRKLAQKNKAEAVTQKETKIEIPKQQEILPPVLKQEIKPKPTKKPITKKAKPISTKKGK